MRALLTEPEVANVAGMTTRNVRRRACELLVEPAGEVSGNGRQPRVYQLPSLSPKLQDAWLAEQQKASAAQPAETALDLAVALPGGLSLSPEDRAEAERRYNIIEPIVVPDKFQLVWLENGRQKGKLIESLAQQHQIGRRTLYGWLKAWDNSGLPGLVRKGRSDKGVPRCLSAAALDFILAAALPRRGSYGQLSIREIYRAYREERAWRAAHATQKLGEFELRKYARYVDPETGSLKAAAQLPEASYETFRLWYGRIPEAAKTFARRGEEAFHNTQEILSFRALSEIQPLDYVVMDHRRLDIFCMVRSREGWKLVRPWLTAALDMRSRKWLAWAIVETPSSDSIATVLRRVFMR